MQVPLYAVLLFEGAIVLHRHRLDHRRYGLIALFGRADELGGRLVAPDVVPSTRHTMAVQPAAAPSSTDRRAPVHLEVREGLRLFGTSWAAA